MSCLRGADVKIDFELQEYNHEFSVDMQSSDEAFEPEFNETTVVHEDLPVYDGTYVATPKTTEQVLPTKDKVLRDDIAVKAIPAFSVSNTSGGNTFYIASEV